MTLVLLTSCGCRWWLAMLTQGSRPRACLGMGWMLQPRAPVGKLALGHLAMAGQGWGPWEGSLLELGMAQHRSALAVPP